MNAVKEFRDSLRDLLASKIFTATFRDLLVGLIQLICLLLRALLRPRLFPRHVTYCVPLSVRIS